VAAKRCPEKGSGALLRKPKKEWVSQKLLRLARHPRGDWQGGEVPQAVCGGGWERRQRLCGDCWERGKNNIATNEGRALFEYPSSENCVLV